MKRLVYALLATFMIQAAGMLTGIVSARLLGPEGRGLLALVVSWATLWGAIGSLSLNEAVVYFTARSRTAEESGRVLSAGLALACATALVSVGGALLTAALVLPDPSPTEYRAIVLALLFIPAFQLTMVLGAFVQGAGSAALWTAARIAPAVTGAGFALLFIVSDLGRSIDWYIGALLAGCLASGAVVALFLKGEGKRLRSLSSAVMKAQLKYAARIHPAAVGGQRENIDRLLISFLVPAAALGQYAVAATLPAALLALAMTFDMVLFPRVAQEAERERATLLFVRWARMAILAVTAAAVLLALACVVLIPVLFGEAYRQAVYISSIMCGTYLLIGARLVIGSGYKALGQPLRHSRGDLVALAASVVLILPMTQAWGIAGAALAVLVAQVAALALALFSFRATVDYSPWLLFWPQRGDSNFAIVELKRALARKPTGPDAARQREG